MRDTPQREPSTKLHRVLAAHRRRARIIAQLHAQAIAPANKANNDLSAQHQAIKAGIAKHSRWRKADAVIATGILKMIAVTILIAALGSILAFAFWPWWPRGSDMDIGHFAPVIILGLILGLFGWGVVYTSARVEHERGEHRLKKYGSLPEKYGSLRDTTRW
jgi:hypothetical protein